eukprot:CAMPEP_0174362994 /NCGR_PEP_ID=MMETSP0811_2-20130205/66907_1 /TAXON_ID=73025 ORGANISM="Eutreptiella gymnastica-like, Strain CCMP1594" /NCGR_SAMPLE_ID=MMETSP0811_2 /ASSEMBLY_ACC=CAM_ASM_000667 /LENGTH=46 /DNA_ID= /DNA_START= /DNA_END= /DNA_ORIENTATION=
MKQKVRKPEEAGVEATGSTTSTKKDKPAQTEKKLKKRMKKKEKRVE